jgi:phosphoribosyl-ATP pyrophosphohydrolase
MKKQYIPTLQERRVESYFTEKYGSDNEIHFQKLKEEFEELKVVAAFENEERFNEELSDVLCVITHIANRRGLTVQKMLDMALEKAKIRETNPNYKR